MNATMNAYRVTFKANDVFQAHIAHAPSTEAVAAWYAANKPNYEIIDVVETCETPKPGQPVIEIEDQPAPAPEAPKANTTTLLHVKSELSNRKDRSAWDRGVTEYALDLLDNIEAESLEAPVTITKADLLNGADNWNQYSWGGSALIYDCDIAERLCSPSELKRRKGGDLPPNSREEWLDVQARALNQACRRILTVIRGW